MELVLAPDLPVLNYTGEPNLEFPGNDSWQQAVVRFQDPVRNVGAGGWNVRNQALLVAVQLPLAPESCRAANYMTSSFNDADPFFWGNTFIEWHGEFMFFWKAGNESSFMLTFEYGNSWENRTTVEGNAATWNPQILSAPVQSAGDGTEHESDFRHDDFRGVALGGILVTHTATLGPTETRSQFGDEGSCAQVVSDDGGQVMQQSITPGARPYTAATMAAHVNGTIEWKGSYSAIAGQSSAMARVFLASPVMESKPIRG